MLSNLTEIVGPFESDAIISCAGSSNLTLLSEIVWYSSIDNFNSSLPLSPFTESPIISQLYSNPSSNGTLLDIHFGYFFQSTNYEAIYLCIAPNQDDDLVMFFLSIYSKHPGKSFLFNIIWFLTYPLDIV